MEKYKLMMFGFGIKFSNLSEVYNRLSQIPVARARVEGLEQCYLVDLESGEKYEISHDDWRYFVVGLENPRI